MNENDNFSSRRVCFWNKSLYKKVYRPILCHCTVILKFNCSCSCNSWSLWVFSIQESIELNTVLTALCWQCESAECFYWSQCLLSKKNVLHWTLNKIIYIKAHEKHLIDAWRLLKFVKYYSLWHKSLYHIALKSYEANLSRFRIRSN